MHTELKTAPERPAQKKITFALDKYPDVARMIERHEKDYPGTTKTHVVISSLREWLTKRGYARKKDLAQ